MKFIPTESILAGDGQVLQIYRVNGIEPQIMDMAQKIFKQIAANNQQAFEGTSRMTQLPILCNGHETHCESATDLAELLSLLEIPTDEAVMTMEEYFASSINHLIVNSKPISPA